MTNKRHLGDDEGLGRVQGFSVVVVDDDAIVRAWVRDTLEAAGISLIGEAATEAEGLQAVQRLQPDVLLTAYRLPDRTGIELMLDLKAYRLDVTGILVSKHPEAGLNEIARAAGFHGTIVKSGESRSLVDLLGEVAAGGTWFDSAHPPRPPGQAPLSPRERVVLRLVARGSTNRQIASELAISDETVKTLLARTYTKLGVVNRTAAVATAIKLGLI